jgi:hypothetical protein
MLSRITSDSPALKGGAVVLKRWMKYSPDHFSAEPSL